MTSFATPPEHSRLWRSPESDFYGDETLHAAEVYTDAALSGIASSGFTGIWLRGKLYDLMRSSVLPELNQPGAEERLTSLRTVIERGQRLGLAVYLYFNEPLAPVADHAVWAAHPELRGRSLDHPLTGPVTCLCPSYPGTLEFMREATSDVLGALPGLAGVVLITASEYPTHCWSHHALRSLGDGIVEPEPGPMACPRCAEREPAEIVGDLIRIWSKSANRCKGRPRVWAWNWSWSMWYPDPQTQVIERLPKDAVLLADWERGGRVERHGIAMDVDEYSLGYAGPSERFLQTEQHARRLGLDVATKLQVGATHELAAVPNLPLIGRLHDKLCGLQRRGIRDLLGCWNFGCGLTLNTEAVALFNASPESHLKPEGFMQLLARRYFGDTVDTPAVCSAWHAFGKAFDHYPLANRLLYFSPINYAPAYPLTPDYRDEPMGWSWVDHQPWGDRVESFLGPFSLPQVLAMFEQLEAAWSQGLVAYRQALGAEPPSDGPAAHRRFEELSCAEMIALHARGMVNILRFATWRECAMRDQVLTGPCRLTPDDEALELMSAQRRVMAEALVLTEKDPRLGYHQECRAYLCGPDRIRAGIQHMDQAMSRV